MKTNHCGQYIKQNENLMSALLITTSKKDELYKLCDTFQKVIKQADEDIADLRSKGHRLALELECLLMDTKDTTIQSKWWESALEALEDWRN